MGINSLERRKEMLTPVAYQVHGNAIVSNALESQTDPDALRGSRSKICIETWDAHERTFRFSGFYWFSIRPIQEMELSRFSKSDNSLANQCNAHAQQDERNSEIELPNVYRPDQANAQPTGRHRQWKENHGCL